MAEIKVLLVDDEEDYTAALAKRFKVRGMVAQTASSGKAALETVMETDFDVVFLDLAMPGWDGVETLKHLLEAKPDLQVVLLTGHATVPAGVEVMKLGAMDLLEKPAEFEDLLAKVDEAAAKTKLLRDQRMESDLGDIIKKKSW